MRIMSVSERGFSSKQKRNRSGSSFSTPARPWKSCMSASYRRCDVSWKRVHGHDALVLAFQRVIRRQRLAHAYLFTGPPGVGKKLFAVELAKTLLCEAQD